MSYLAPEGWSIARDRFALGRAREARWPFAAAFNTEHALQFLDGEHAAHALGPVATSGFFGQSITLLSAFSMSMWINPNGSPNFVVQSNQGFFGAYGVSGPSTSGFGFMGGTTAGQMKFHVGTHTTATQNAVASGIVSGVWNHLVGTWDATASPTMLVYRNGVVQVDSGTRSTGHTLGQTIMAGSACTSGSTSFVAGNFPNVLMRDMAVWNRALTSGEANSLYNGGAPFNIVSDVGLASGLRLWIRGGDGHHDSPERWFDQSGNGHHLFPTATFREARPRAYLLGF